MQGSPSSQYWGSAQFQIQVGQSRHSIRLGGGPPSVAAARRPSPRGARPPPSVGAELQSRQRLRRHVPRLDRLDRPASFTNLGGGGCCLLSKKFSQFSENRSRASDPPPSQGFQIGPKWLKFNCDFFFKKKDGPFSASSGQPPGGRPEPDTSQPPRGKVCVCTGHHVCTEPITTFSPCSRQQKDIPYQIDS